MKYLSLILLVITLSASATDVVREDYEDGTIKLNIVKVWVDDFDIIKMENPNRIEMDLICGTNFFHNNRRPVVRYRNYYNIVVDDFEISSTGVCIDLKEFLIKTFEGINENAPLKFELDLKTRKVTKIIYPKVDPYYQGPYEGFEDPYNYKQLY